MSPSPAPMLRCGGCGHEIGGDAGSPFRCPNAGRDGGDHVLARVLDASVAFPRGDDPNPFVRYRTLTLAHALATSRGMNDDAFVALVRELDASIASVDRVGGCGFRITPFAPHRDLASALGLRAVWVKDETGNVSGSHKGRHLMGLAILGEVRARLGIGAAGGRLAIASCGNAALGAAVVARAWDKQLDVFIPADANVRVVAELERLGAAVHVCRRSEGVPGDPCYVAFRVAVDGGAVPFCCQGSDNGLTLEGGETLAWEMADELARSGASIDRLFVQVGGGALASACVRGLREAASLGIAIPRIHPVQTEGGFPLRRAWERVVMRLGFTPGQDDAAIAERLRGGSRDVTAALDYAAHHRAEFMWPWESEPHSIAHGILDDETYDWLEIVRGTIESGGFPILVGEARLQEATDLASKPPAEALSRGREVDPTGASGLAGLLELHARGGVGADESVAVIFSGARR